MEAALVWRVWRRLLREPAMREAVLGGRLDERAAALGLGPAEIEVARAYAEHPAGTEMFVHSYRFRMVSSFFNAVETVAPLTHRALLANDVDLRAIAVELLDRREWVDAGPFVYTFGGQILDHLAADGALGEIAGLRELIALERAAADVVITAAAGHPTARDKEPAAGQWRVRAPFGVHSCERDLSEWLRDSGTLGRSVPPAASRHYLIFLPAPEAERRIVAVPRRASDILRILGGGSGELPLLTAELARRGHPAAPGRDRAILDRFEALGLLAAPVGGS
ncbi:hypothetical protein [Streptomyces sp. NPDC058653]|uniref:hypothetical protein n=1 Tax=Streptomyces sp. NPDC058653 TaxID=3346576 RepID=UPI00364986D0